MALLSFVFLCDQLMSVNITVCTFVYDAETHNVS